MNVVEHLTHRLQLVIAKTCGLLDRPARIDDESSTIMYGGCDTDDRREVAKYAEWSGLRDSGIVDAVVLDGDIIYVSIDSDTLINMYVIFKQMETVKK